MWRAYIIRSQRRDNPQCLCSPASGYGRGRDNRGARDRRGGYDDGAGSQRCSGADRGSDRNVLLAEGEDVAKRILHRIAARYEAFILGGRTGELEVSLWPQNQDMRHIRDAGDMGRLNSGGKCNEAENNGGEVHLGVKRRIACRLPKAKHWSLYAHSDR